MELKAKARKVHAKLFGKNALAKLDPGVEDLEELQALQEQSEDQTASKKKEDLEKSPFRIVLESEIEDPFLRFLEQVTGIDFSKQWKKILIGVLTLGLLFLLPNYLASLSLQKPIATPTPIVSPSPEATSKEIQVSIPQDIYHKVKKGESLSEIAARYYFNPWDYKKIYDENRNSFKYPWPELSEDYKEELPFPSQGDELFVPDAVSPYYYRVERGETFEEIVERYYGKERSEAIEILPSFAKSSKFRVKN